ncbi:LURP-one-related/scramblase family protein [Sporosarcina siberiensis]|uniref:LURP-one-related/scramblase family protein n=1 Tax=Sporosarcina siberiensis TaxID=1365606 RepID=A0ABW4SI65_9BACL
MKTLYIKQKIFSLGGKFTVKDVNEVDVYYIEGSLMKIPKSYSIKNAEMDKVALITKKMFSLMPTFFVETVGQEDVTIKKEFTFFKPKYTINAIGIDVQGNWWDMNFKVVQNGEVIGVVDKKWFTWGDSYQIQIMKEETESLIIALVVAIDCAKATQAATNSSI